MYRLSSIFELAAILRHISILKQKLVRQSFYCGLITFGICFLLALLEALSALLVFSIVLPGFFYGWILSGISNFDFTLKKVLFVLLSGGLFIFVAWIATGYSFLGDNMKVCVPISSIIGSTTLLSLYYLLIDNKIAFVEGLIIAVLVGLISSLLPFTGDILQQSINNIELKRIIDLSFPFLIFPVWQTLFGWTICKTKNIYSQQAALRYGG